MQIFVNFFDVDIMDIDKYNNFIDSTIYPDSNFVEVKKYQAPWVERHVAWITVKDRPQVAKIAVIALAVFEAVLLAASVLGIFFVAKAIDSYNKQNLVNAFFKAIQDISPPEAVPLNSKTSAFNHINHYSIHNGVIWYKPIRETGASWKAVYFDGFPQRSPVEIQTDGCNLIVIDDIGDVHYKKVIEDDRESTTEIYQYVDVTEDNEWIDIWYSFPILHNIMNIFWGKRLNISQDEYRSWAISHRGCFNYCFQDALDNTRYQPVGTTSLFALTKDGKSLKVFDPWSPRNADVILPMPQSKDSYFEGVSISASSSTVMVIGYEVQRGSCEKVLKAYTWFVDIDTLGWNPAFFFDYACNKPGKFTTAIPLEEWREHKLPNTSQFTDNHRIVQTGMGNGARMQIIQGRQGDLTGYFWKEINKTEWSFQEDPLELSEFLPEKVSVDSNTSFTPSVSDYKGTIWNGDKEISDLSLHLEGYGATSYLSTLTIKDGNQKTIPLFLNKRKTLKNFIGSKEHLFEIAYPDPNKFTIDQDLKERLKKLFKGKKVITVSVKEDESGGLSIKAGKITFKLKRTAE